MLTFGDLFAGIGGFSLGFERAGLVKRWSVEIDPYCQKVLRKHWPHCGEWDDVRTFPPHPAEDWSVDVICGGDPCQENSKARHRDAIHKSLGGEFIRVVDAIRPSIVVRENTPARKDAPWPWWRFRSELESIGYVVLPFRLRACCLGADHRRERVFLLAILSDASGQRLEGMLHTGNRHSESGGIKSRCASAGVSGTHRGQQWKDKPAILRVADGLPCRVERLTAIGNSVCPQVAEYIGRRILESIGA